MSEQLRVLKPRIIIYFSLIIFSFSLLSCSPQKRLHRLLALHPELVTNDTIRIQDTTFLPEVKFDTAIFYQTLKDTITITKEKLQIKFYEKNDTIYLDTHLEPDTIIISKTIPVEKIIYKKSKTLKDRIFNFIGENNPLTIFFIIILIVLILKSFFKK